FKNDAGGRGGVKTALETMCDGEELRGLSF
ncbi:unnamed protein product, partial [Didymodactylos carnosus]